MHTQYVFGEEFLEGAHPEGRGHRRIILRIPINMVGPDSAVGIATRYGLNSPGIESRWGRDFPHPSRPALGPTQPPIQWVPGPSRVKTARTWR